MFFFPYPTPNSQRKGDSSIKPTLLSGSVRLIGLIVAMVMQFAIQAQTNGVLRQVYTGIAGTAVADLTNSPSFPYGSSSNHILPTFEAPSGVGDNYGQRLTAFLTPPATGSYVFWIASDDNSVLYLGTNDLAAGKQAIASVPGYTASREWTKYAAQQSAAIPLVGGQRYYVEALMKEGAGADNLAVRWQLPGGTIEEPIPSTRLQAFRLANPDAVTLRYGGKARVNVVANDAGYLGGAVEILAPPASGTVAVNADGTILYTHTSGQPASDSFTYRLPAQGGVPPTDPATVTINFTTAARFASDFVRLPPQPPPTIWQLRDAFPSLTFSAPNSMCSALGDRLELFLVESAGRVWLIPDVAAPTPQKVLFLDITDRVNSDGFERGAKGVACHPGYSTNGFLFVTYNTLSNGVVRVRVSRFTRSTGNPLQADPASELILINQVDDGPYHDIDTCRFGPDGYLYVALGDEGGQNEEYQNAQRIDKDLYSCIIRIDVDKRPGNLEPNFDTDIPLDSNGKAYFSVPADNPFVGATNFNKQPVNPAQVRTEIYVLGLRNPWQFSFDPGTARLWVADVGRDAREEVSLLGPGQNGGWSWREGSLPGPRTGQVINGAIEADATLIDPVFEYSHNGGSASITGGFIYAGTNYPGLNGRYIFSDYILGSIWTFAPTNPAATLTRLTGGQNIVAFLTDPSNNDIIMIERGGVIRRLVSATDDSSFPQSLSQTGFFADLATLTPNPGAEAYEPNLRFWSDYADKSRWFLIKDATNTLAYSRDGLWTFPPGMIWAKHFELDITRGDPATSKRIETRFLVKTAQNAYGVSYVWNNAGTEAFLAPDSGTNLDLTVVENGVPRIQHYRVPARSECVTCHTPEAGSALSFNTRQLNRDGTIAGSSGNLLTLLASAGYLSGLNDNPTVTPRHVRPDETQYSIESRVRSYLAVNCGNCHHPGASGPPSWDASPTLNLWQTRLINGLPLAGSLDASHRLIIPGDTARSILWSRVSRTNGYAAMPPLASNERDHAAAQLLADWIVGTLPSRLDYDAWRLAYFGNLFSPEGERSANPDGDQDTNEAEFLKFSNPTNRLDFYKPRIATTPTQVSIELPSFPARRVTVETSTNLQNANLWSPWLVVGNTGMPLAPGQTNILSGPVTDPYRFFKIRIEEE